MKLGIAAAAVAVIYAVPVWGQGQQSCGERAAVIETLASRYGESRQSIGLGAQGRVVEVFASLETGTWTITVTLPSGLTCLVASGQSFERLDEPAPAQGEEM